MPTDRRHFLLAMLGMALLPGCERRNPPPTTFPALGLQPLDRPPGTGTVPAGPLVVNFWATWCAPCRREMASLERLSRRLAPRVQVVGVTADEDLDLAVEWLRRQGIRFPNFSDPGLRVSRPALGLDALPHTFVVARDGRIALQSRGAREWDAEDSVAQILGALA